MRPVEYEAALRTHTYDTALSEIYPDVTMARVRIQDALVAFARHFSDLAGDEAYILSAPGRTEVSGNHTDYNHGAVLAAAINLDMLAVAAPTNNDAVMIYSEGFGVIAASLADLSVRDEEKGTPAALVRGVAADLKARSYAVGGFCAYITSDVLRGSGLSSSAAFEMLLAAICSHLYNGGRVSGKQAAFAGKHAENVYFGKPCGLMDQMACSMGGFVKMDFRDPEAPIVTSIPAIPHGYALCIVDTRGDHAGLTEEYAAASRETASVAAFLGRSNLRELDASTLFENALRVRQACGDRAFLRAAHFFFDNERVFKQADSLLRNDIQTFLALVNESGRSSFMYLQNVYTNRHPHMQPVSLALCMSDYLLNGHGAFRVHGGGFAGTIQAWVPQPMLEAYRKGMDGVFGKGSCAVLSIRKQGIMRLLV
ncbi:MAG: galactokinase [Clostridiales bacterium]|jgi:galactokinase|nr:galactokinase [Clostridiales bacterium]